MTPKIAFAIVMFGVFIHVGRRGDLRDWLGAFVILSQTALVWFALELWKNNDIPPGIIYALVAPIFITCSKRHVGTFLGILSAMCGALFFSGYFGIISSEPWQGFSWNVHNLTTILCYIQLLILGGSCSGFLHRDYRDSYSDIRL